MVIWAYLVVERQKSGWTLAGELSSTFSFAADASLAEVLNTVGERGWELAAASGVGAADAVYVFKRPADIGEEDSG
jgi:hypothetical protein